MAKNYSTVMPTVFEKELSDGEGIFQADRGTDLWHEVTAIKAMDGNKPAYRSSLGFDVSVTRCAA
ncbi:2OG-Fe dioxygenase family protein [Mycobacterium simiae]|uniref:2OG-Fe dioxygenase family protein n=1 Tax=Mycobacterium simiae TaxID=1784 RepID=A0A5B1B4F1_MYCSI|nr:2OG-Fe dioxygenase family protein [Mycobacterium simiae]